MMQVVQYVQPEKKGEVSQLKQLNQVTFLRELTAGGGSTKYEELVERVSDDLLENVNNQLDFYKRELANPEGGRGGSSETKVEYFNQEKQLPKSDNAMLKP